MTDVGSMDKQEETSDAQAEDDLPQHILEKYDSDLQVQIIRGYRILQVITYYLKDNTFFERPANEERVGRLYYDVIKNPMYFNEIKRKIFDAEYGSLADIIKDMRLVFENCYYFWGPKTSMSEQCVKIERLMEKQLLSLPRDLRIQCSLEETHGKNTDKVVTKIWNRYRNKGKGCSNLMLRTWRKRRFEEEERYRIRSDLTNYCACKKQILKWEKEVLHLEEQSNSIFNIQQLPQIGQFFHVIADVLQKKPYCQIEIERMFLIPSHSQSFREILTLLLIDEFCEEPAAFDDLMIKLKQLLVEWYSIYDDKNQNDIEASRIIGVEPEFFQIMSETNPLLTTSYENLSYRQKVVIVKSLCDRFVHNNSNIKEAIANADEKIFASQTIGRDKFGYSYLFFNTFLDFRLYKQKLMEDDDGDDVSSNNKLRQDFQNVNETLKKFFPRSCANFEMVADSIEKLRCLVDDLIYSDVETSKKDGKSTNYEVIESLRNLESRIIENENSYIDRANRARVKLYDEWRSLERRLKIYRLGNNFSDAENWSNECCEDADSDQALASDADASNHGCAVSESEVRKSANNTDDADRIEDDSTTEVKIEHETLTNETRVEGFFVKTEIKDEPSNDEFASTETSNVVSLRRRSSVASYNVFDKKLFFSDESGSESPEEFYSEGDDSDDDWDVPKKKSKKAPKNKLVKQLKLNAEDAARRRKNNRRKSERAECETAAESKLPSASVEMEHTTIKKEEELDIVDSITTTNSEEYGNGGGGGGGGTVKEDDDQCKPEQKIKVIDLARLQNSQNVSKTSNDQKMECAPMPRIVSQGTLRVPPHNAAAVNAVPMMSSPVVSSSTPNVGDAFAVHPTTFAIVAQPQAYIITTNQGPFQATPAPQYQMQSFTSAPYGNRGIASTTGVAQNTRMPRIVNATGTFVNTAAPNNKLMLVNQNAPIRFPPSAPSQQAVRTPSSVANKSIRFRPNPTPTFTRQMPPSLSVKNNYVRNSAPSKFGRNVTVVPKVINKIYEKGNSFKEIEGAIGIHSNNGTLQYVVNLANGTHVPLTNEQVQKLREGNNGALPLKLKIPVPMDVAEKIEPCVVIDD